MNNKLIAALILVSSFLLSSDEEKDQYKPKLPNFKDILEVKHSIPGRIRIQCKVLKDNPHGKQALLNTFSQIPGITEISINPYIGTILIKYEEETIGSIMSKDFISFNLDITIGEIIDILRESNPEDEELNSIFIKDEDEKVIGIIELKDLILNSANVKAKEVMNENINILKHNESINEAVEIASKYDLMAIPVVDNSDVLIGVVNTHDLIDEVLYPMWKKKNK